MACCGHSRSQVVPDGAEVGATQIPTPRVPRVNGWDRPFSLYQVAAWVLLFVITVVTFGVLIPMLLPTEQKYAYGFTSGSALLCAMSYIITVTLDPAVEELRNKKDTEPRPTTNHSVIQMHYCPSCRINVKITAHHCRQCNKCVAGFDHHCIWINNCVGERNYWWFFTCLSSLVAWITCALMISVVIMVRHFVNPSVLRTHSRYNNIHDNNTWLMFLPLGLLTARTAIVLTVEVIMLLIELVIYIALVYLLVFHLHLIWNRTTTLNYLRKKKQKKANASSNNNKRFFEMRVLPKETERNSKSDVCRCPRLCSTITEAFWEWKDTLTGKRTPVRRLRIQGSALAEFPKAPIFRIPMTAAEFHTDNPLPGSCQYVVTQERQDALPDNRDTIIKIAESAIDNVLLSSSWNEPPQETQCTLREGPGVQTMPSTAIISMGELEERQALSDESVSSPTDYR